MANYFTLRFVLSTLFFMAVATAQHARAEGETVHILSGGPAGLKAIGPIEADVEKATGTSIELSQTRMESAVKGFVAGTVEIVLCPKLPLAFAAAEKDGMPTQDVNDYLSAKIFSEPVLMLLHPSNPTTTLTHDQLVGILSGTIKSWKSINGKDAPIEVLFPKNLTVSMKTLTMYYLKAPTSPAATLIPTQDGVIKKIEISPDAIGFTSAYPPKSGFQPKTVRTEAKFELFIAIKKTARPTIKKVFENVASRFKFD